MRESMQHLGSQTSGAVRQRLLLGTVTQRQTTVITGLMSEAPTPEREYVDEINAPLSRATVIALRDELKSGNYARYKKVRKQA